MQDKNISFDFDLSNNSNSIETLSDLEEKEFLGKSLTELEQKALKLFRTIRLKSLKKNKLESQFHDQFEYFRTIYNLMDYRDFLKREYV